MSEYGGWKGIRVRLTENGIIKEGIVSGDYNSFLRILNISLDNGDNTRCITMSNVGNDPNPEELKKWDWLDPVSGKWYNFG